MAKFPTQGVPGVPPRPSLEEAQALLPKSAAQRRLPLWTDSELGQHIVIAQKATELDTLRRKEREAWNATALALETAQEPEARQALYEGYLKQTAALSSQHPEVNQALQSHLNDVIPTREMHFNKIDRDIAVARIGDELKYNLESTYQADDRQAFDVMRFKAVAAGVITPEASEHLDANYQANVDRVKIEGYLAAGTAESLNAAIALSQKYAAAPEVGKEGKDFARLSEKEKTEVRRAQAAVRRVSTEQRSAIREAERTARKMILEAKQQFDEELATRVMALEASKPTTLDWEQGFDAIDAWAAADPRVNPEQLLQAKDMIRRRRRGTDMADVNREADDRRRVYSAGESGEDSTQLRADINAHYVDGVYGHGKTAADTRTSLLKTLESGKRQVNWRATEGPRGMMRDRFPPASNEVYALRVFLYERAVADWLDEHPDAEPEEAFAKAETLRTVYRDTGEEALRSALRTATQKPTAPTAVNPKTGERLILKDGKWQPLK